MYKSQTIQYSITENNITRKQINRILVQSIISSLRVILKAQFIGMRHIFNWMNCKAPRGQMEENGAGGRDKYGSIARA